MSQKVICTNLFAVALLGIFSLSLTGCSVQDTTATNTTGTAATPTPTATPTATPGTGQSSLQSNITEFAVTTPANANYSAVLSKWTGVGTTGSDGTTPCKATAGQDVLCVLDMDELDVLFRGYTFNDTVPGSMCAYRSFIPYFYNVAPVGCAPTAVAYTVDTNGTVVTNATPSFSHWNAATLGASGSLSAGPGNSDDIYYFIPTSCDVSNVGSWQSHQTIYGTKAKKPSDLKCPFNYSSIGNGKNCCYGTYDLDVYSTVAATGNAVSPGVDWGGKYGNCFAGPALDNPKLPVNFDGMPSVYVTNAIDLNVKDSGLLTSLTMAPRTWIDTFNYLYLNNWFNTSLYSGGIPNAFKPAAFYYGNSNSLYYTYECLDEAYEQVARIRILVRGWSTDSEFKKFLAGDFTANPELVGAQTTPSNPTRGSDSFPTNPTGANQDFCNWDSFLAGGTCDWVTRNTNNYSVTFGFNSATSPSTIGIWSDPGGASANTFHYINFQRAH